MLKLHKKKMCTLLIVLIIAVNFMPILVSTVIAYSILTIKINDDTFIINDGEYNESHGIEGVSYDFSTDTLTLTNADIENIYCNSNLIIRLVGTNVINNIDGFRAIEARGNIYIKGDGGTLNISTNDVAVEIGAGCRLTIGDEENLEQHVTVNVQNGRNINTADTYVVEGSIYNFPEDLGPGGPGGDPIPFKLFIEGVLVIDESVEPKIESGEGAGYTVEKLGFVPGYIITVNTSVVSNIGSIETEGDNMLVLSADGDLIVEANEFGYSVDCKDNTDFFTAKGGEQPKITFYGSIRTLGSVFLDDTSVDFGGIEYPLSKGIECRELNTSFSNVRIYSTDYAFENIQDIFVYKKSNIEVNSYGTATNNVGKIHVYEGGKIYIDYSSMLGTFASEAGHWPWLDMVGTEEDREEGDFPQPIFVDCTTGNHPVDKYTMIDQEGHFVLESTAKAMYTLSSNIQNGDTVAADSLVTNGRVRVMSAYGYKQVAPDYIDYVIEEGSNVTIELLPDYGYQYVSGGLNGVPTSPETGKATYTFTMPANHIHLSAIFEATEDIINVNTNDIEDASIVVPQGEINGNAEFNIETTTVEDTTNFVEAAGDKEIGTYLDLALNEYILKGNGNDDAWTEPISNLSEEMTVSLKLANNIRGKTGYSIIREHDGQVEIIPSTYDLETNTITFETDKYSTYAISYDKSIVEEDNLVDDGIVKTMDTIILVAVSIIAVVVISNVIVSTRRKKLKYAKKI